MMIKITNVFLSRFIMKPVTLTSLPYSKTGTPAVAILQKPPPRTPSLLKRQIPGVGGGGDLWCNEKQCLKKQVVCHGVRPHDQLVHSSTEIGWIAYMAGGAKLGGTVVKLHQGSLRKENMLLYYSVKFWPSMANVKAFTFWSHPFEHFGCVFYAAHHLTDLALFLVFLLPLINALLTVIDRAFYPIKGSFEVRSSPKDHKKRNISTEVFVFTFLW